MMNEKSPSAAEIGAKGGTARAKSLTPEQRSDAARKAIEARWAKEKGVSDVPKATHEGILQVGELEIPCAIVSLGGESIRLLSESGVVTALGLYRSGKILNQERDNSEPGAQLPLFVANKNIKPFVDEDLADVLRNPIWFVPQGSGTKNKGVRAELIPKICEVWLKARDAGVLRGTRQPIVAAKADMIIRALAHVGIIALVDEATGFQYDRPRRDLEDYLKKFLSESLRRWVRTFPADYFKHLCRLRKVELRSDMKLPQYFGVLTNNLVYRRIAPGLLKKLKQRRVELGRPNEKLHSGLSLDVGIPEVLVHLGTVVGLMKLHTDYDAFEKQLGTIAPIYPETPGLFDDPKDWEAR
jgi:hypothetical protein